MTSVLSPQPRAPSVRRGYSLIPGFIPPDHTAPPAWGPGVGRGCTPVCGMELWSAIS
jgi:hypothetical protein